LEIVITSNVYIDLGGALKKSMADVINLSQKSTYSGYFWDHADCNGQFPHKFFLQIYELRNIYHQDDDKRLLDHKPDILNRIFAVLILE
jgi:hypothetical protein